MWPSVTLSSRSERSSVELRHLASMHRAPQHLAPLHPLRHLRHLRHHRHPKSTSGLKINFAAPSPLSARGRPTTFRISRDRRTFWTLAVVVASFSTCYARAE